jgi:quercetin dioxygenase-like cupin family protein
MGMTAVSAADTTALDGAIAGHWSSTDLLTVNGNTVRFRIMQDATAPWHTHRGSDEFFLVLSGDVTIETREGGEGGAVIVHGIRPGQMLAVHPGTEHRARCIGRATLVVIDDIERLG